MRVYTRVKFSFGKREFIIIMALLLFAFIVRLLFFPLSGYKNDTGVFIYWFNTAAEHGPRLFYNVVYSELGWIDYPPFNAYIFWAFGSLSNALSSLLGTNVITSIIKLPPNLFDMATAFLIFAIVRKRFTFKMGLLAAGLYAFNPAVIFNAAVWGQFDAIYTFFLVLSLYLFFESKPQWAVVAFMLGVLTKPQSIALAPLVVFLVFKVYKWNWKGLLISFLAAVGTIFAVILPFEWSNPVTFLSNIYFGAYNNYQATSINAFNFWAFGGMWVSDTQTSLLGSPYIIGWVLFAALSLFVLYFVHRRFGFNSEFIIIFAAFALFFGFFMLPTRIHERYLFPAMAMLALGFPFLKRLRPLYIILTATCFINQAYVLHWLNVYAEAGYSYGPNLSGDPVVLIVSLINSLAFVYVIMLMFGELRGKRWLGLAPVKPSMNVIEEATQDEAR